MWPFKKKQKVVEKKVFNAQKGTIYLETTYGTYSKIDIQGYVEQLGNWAFNLNVYQVFDTKLRHWNEMGWIKVSDDLILNKSLIKSVKLEDVQDYEIKLEA